MMGGGSETHSVIKAVRYDVRVRKIYGELLKLDKDEAAETVSQAFERSLSAGNKHGRHATLFLAFKFCPRKEFIRMLDDWMELYAERTSELLEEFAEEEFESPEVQTKLSFLGHYTTPEVLMILNLALIDQVDEGKSLEEALVTVQDILDGVVKNSHRILSTPHDVVVQSVVPFGKDDESDIEPLVEFHEFSTWDGLDIADLEARIKIIERVRESLAKN